MNRLKLIGKIAEAGLTQRKVAEAVGMSENSFSRKVCGLNEFKADEILAVSSVLGIEDADEIVNIFLSTSTHKTG